MSNICKSASNLENNDKDIVPKIKDDDKNDKKGEICDDDESYADEDNDDPTFMGESYYDSLMPSTYSRTQYSNQLPNNKSNRTLTGIESVQEMTVRMNDTSIISSRYGMESVISPISPIDVSTAKEKKDEKKEDSKKGDNKE